MEISETRVELEEEGEDEWTERVYGVPDRLTGREAVAELCVYLLSSSPTPLDVLEFIRS